MVMFSYNVQEKIGLHARPAGLIAECASRFDSDIKVNCNGKTVDAKVLFMLIFLGAKHGDNVIFTIDGPDEQEAKEALEKKLKECL